MKAAGRNKSRMKKLQGKLRQKAKGGNYYYRLTIANGIRNHKAPPVNFFLSILHIKKLSLLSHLFTVMFI